MTHPEGPWRSDEARFAERIGAPVFVWILIVVLCVSLGIAYGAAIGWGWGLLTFMLSGALCGAWLYTARAQIAVDDETFVAGRATIELRFIGDVVALDREQTRTLAGPGADARAYLLLRGSTATAVKVVIDDPTDPTPYWLVATSRPVELRDAILAARATAPRQEP